MKKTIHCLILVLALILINSTNVFSLTFYRSVTSGNWNSISTWEKTTDDGNTWLPSNTTPGFGKTTIRNGNLVTVTANVDVNEIVIDSGGTISINPGIIFTVNHDIQNSIEFTISLGGTINGAGIMQTKGNVDINIRNGSNFNAALKVNTGTAIANDLGSPFIGNIFGTVTVDNGAVLTAGTGGYSFKAHNTVTNNGTIGGLADATFIMKNSTLINNNLISAYNFRIDTTVTISGTGAYTSNIITIGSSGNLSLANDITFNPAISLNINGGGVLNLNTRTLTFNSGILNILTGGTILNSGIFRTQNNISLNIRDGSNFNAPLKVNTGTTIANDLVSPFIGRLFGTVTVDNGATLSAGTGAYFLETHKFVTNNGTIAGTGNATFILKSPNLINNNSISVFNLRLDTTSLVSGTGSFTSSFIDINTSGNIALSSNVTFSPQNSFRMISGSNLNLNTRTLTLNSGTFLMNNNATIINSGLFMTQGTILMDLRNGSNFNAPLKVNTGTTTANSQVNPFTGSLYGTVTIDIGTTLNIGNGGYSMEAHGNLTNNGTIAGVSGATLRLFGSEFINNGNTNVNLLYIETGPHTLAGTGSITSNTSLLSGANVTMTSNHQMANVNINSGASFDISNFKLKLTASNPINQNGSFIGGNSKVEYNGTAIQTISTANINYNGLIINNNAGAILSGNTIIPDTLNLNLGDLNLNGNNITFTPDGYLKETPNNIVFGNTGYLTTTRTLGAPTALNVAGFGAVITTSTVLGSTEVRRGHTIQNGLNGGTSIKRYYDIDPASNSGLNATLVYNYDDTELDGTPEPSMKLFRSTNSGSTWTYQGGVVNTVSNQITLNGINSFSRWSADSAAVSASIKLALEAFYNPSINYMNFSDTVRAYLRNTSAPYNVVDSAKSIVNFFTMKAAFQFNIAGNGTYYLQIKHRNAIETWSATGLSYNTGMTLNHDFTNAANKAFGSNQSQVDLSPATFAFWSGDVNQDGAVDVTDASLVDNDAGNFITGYVPTDVNGDGIVDVADGVFADNNGLNFVGKITP